MPFQFLPECIHCASCYPEKTQESCGGFFLVVLSKTCQLFPFLLSSWRKLGLPGAQVLTRYSDSSPTCDLNKYLPQLYLFSYNFNLSLISELFHYHLNAFSGFCYFICMSVLPSCCMYAPYSCLVVMEVRKRFHSYPLELELWMNVSHHVGSRAEIRSSA